MVDISMCANNECELRSTCYRYRAIPSQYRQSYSVFNCNNTEDWFIPIDKSKVVDYELELLDKGNAKIKERFDTTN